MGSQVLETLILINAQAGSGFAQVGDTLMQMGRLVQQLTGGLQEFYEESMGVYKDFDTNMALAEIALASTYGQGTKELGDVMDRLRQQTMDWAQHTMFTTEDVSEAVKIAARSFSTEEEILSAIPGAMTLAMASEMGLSEATDYMIATMKALNIPLEDTAQFTDNWAFAANRSRGSIETFGQAMEAMGSTMRFADNYQEIFTMIGALQDMGMSGSQAGTLLRTAMLRVIAPTDTAAEALAELEVSEEELAEMLADEGLMNASAALEKIGFSAFDAQGNVKPMLQIFSELGTALHGLSDEDRFATLKDVFGIRGSVAAQNLMESLDIMSESYSRLMNGEAEGFGEYAADVMFGTFEGQEKLFQSKLEHLQTLVGECLSTPMEQVWTTVGNIADTLSGMDTTAFSALVEGLGAISVMGGGLFSAGLFVKLLGSVLTTQVGGYALAAVALAGVAGAVASLSRSMAEYEQHETFGDMALDVEALKSNLGEMTTPFDDSRTVVDAYAENVKKAADAYSQAATAFSQEITVQALQLEPLSEQEIANLQKMGAEMLAYVQNGLRMAQSRDTSFVNAMFGVESDADLAKLSDEDRELYEALMAGWDMMYSGLYDKAEEIGGKIQNLLNDALSGVNIDRSELQNLLNEYNEIMNEISDYEFAVEQNKIAMKSQRVSASSIKEFMEYLEEQRSAAYSERDKFFDEQLAQQKALYDKGIITREKWDSEVAKVEAMRTEEKAAVDANYADYARTAAEAAFKDSSFGDAFSFVQDALSNGNAYYGENGELLFKEGAVAGRTPTEMQEITRQMELWRSRGGQFMKLLGGYEYDEGIQDMFKMWNAIRDRSIDDWLRSQETAYSTGNAENGMVREDVSEMDRPELLNYMDELLNMAARPGQGEWSEIIEAFNEAQNSFAERFEGEDWLKENGYSLEGLANFDMRNGTVPQEEFTVELPTEPVYTRVRGGVGYTLDPSIYRRPQEQTASVSADTAETQEAINGLNGTEVEAAINGDVTGLSSAIERMNGTEVEAAVNGDVTGLSSDIEGLNGTEVEAAVNGDVTGLSSSIDSQNGRSISVNVSGNLSALQSQLNSLTAHVNATIGGGGAGKFGANYARAAYAGGGRAEEASIFGEAGPEWAIPEEHTQRTADLLDAARAASGFSWGELIGRYGGLNADAGRGDVTVVYSPTIHAADAAGVVEALKEDKKRLEKWMEERALRDRIEVYA